ncbi:MAG: hypothetical protein Athens071425_388 [Parcubacteria group bacterium Athens0714_25]|nr:MAG: hypothetical protein Athens071425_388 [Parcubacteria group bacterium Athens0714_25]
MYPKHPKNAHSSILEVVFCLFKGYDIDIQMAYFANILQSQVLSL